MSSFEDILSKPATQIDRPKPLPTGSYVWAIQGMPRFDKSRDKQTPFYEFAVKAVSALDDVDEEALKEWSMKSDGTQRPLNEVSQKITFYITEGSLYRLQEFLDHCGVAEEGKTTAQCIDDTPNCQFVGNIVHTASKDGSSVYANIGKTAPVE